MGKVSELQGPCTSMRSVNMATSSKPHQALHRYCFIPSALSCHRRQTCCCYCIIPATVVALVSVIDRMARSTVCRRRKSHIYQRCFLLDECISCNADCLIILLLAVSLSSIKCCYVCGRYCIHAACCFLLLLCASYHWHCCCCCCRSLGRDILKPLLLPTAAF